MKILCIVITYNGMKWIERCVQSVMQSSVPADLFVVDNKSNDGTRLFLEKLSVPNVILSLQESNLGFGQANNIGIRYAIDNDYDYVMLLNQDAYLKTDTIEKLLAYTTTSGIYSPIHINGQESRIDNNFKKHSFASNPAIIDDLALSVIKNPYEVKGVNAACWFSSTEIYKKIGGFNPLFHHYGEDSNYICRMHYHHLHYYVVLGCYVIHDRQNYGNVKVYKKDQLTRSFMRIATNINSNLYKRLSGYIKEFLSQGYHEGWIRSFVQLPAAIWTIVKNNSRIDKSRKMEIQIGNNWL